MMLLSVTLLKYRAPQVTLHGGMRKQEKEEETLLGGARNRGEDREEEDLPSLFFRGTSPCPWGRVFRASKFKP